MKKVLYFLGAFFSVVGALGSIGYLLWMKQWIIAIGVGIICFAAYPTIKNWIDKLIHE